MFEKVNKYHPDKCADRIAGAIVDIAYRQVENPKIAVEVLLGHGKCYIIAETSTSIKKSKIKDIVSRIVGSNIRVEYKEVPQDVYLAANQEKTIKCGDNGIFRGVPTSDEEVNLVKIARELEDKYQSDGKYILDYKKLIICQSNAKNEDLRKYAPKAIINPLGEWSGGIDVDSGATNRKIGSDMGRVATGGGLHGKDCSKADVSINIYCYLKAQELNKPYELSCAIGDETVDGKPYSEIVKIAKDYIDSLGGFEKFAEYGLLRADNCN